MRSIAWKRWALEELRCRARQGKTGLPPDGLEIGGFSRNRDYRLCSPDILVILHVVLICFDIYIYIRQTLPVPFNVDVEKKTCSKTTSTLNSGRVSIKIKHMVSLYDIMIILYQFVSHTHMTYAACNDAKACTAYLVCDMKALQRLMVI